MVPCSLTWRNSEFRRHVFVSPIIPPSLHPFPKRAVIFSLNSTHAGISQRDDLCFCDVTTRRLYRRCTNISHVAVLTDDFHQHRKGAEVERPLEGEIRSGSFDSINSTGWWLDCRSIDLHVTSRCVCGRVRDTVYHNQQANALQTGWHMVLLYPCTV
jgi:hypothetical protein